MTTNTWVRDTLIRLDVYNSLPEQRQVAIKLLVIEYEALGYIDARTELGPDQAARMSQRQKDALSEKTLKAFWIEDEIRELLKSDEQLAEERKAQELKDLEAKRQYLRNSIRMYEECCTRKLASKRDNGTKRHYAELKAQLKALG
jgi:hypothetical protein